MLRLRKLPDGRKAIVIRTSDRISFKKCRRSWSWSSHLQRNLTPTSLPGPLWFGSGIHYALEVFHGHKEFERASDAFAAYCIATSKQHIRDLPNDAPELYRMGISMMDYYQDHWLNPANGRKEDQTYWHQNPATGKLEPQIEVDFEIEVPLHEPGYAVLSALATANGADCVIYRGTIDRMAIDEFGNLWVVEYKTAKVLEHNHYQTDPQVTTYVWAASHIYDRPVVGVIYMQFLKKSPELPKILASGKITTASNLITSAPLYRKALTNLYGDAALAPEANREYLTQLMMKETEDADRFVHRERIYRNAHMCDAEAIKILLELEDMLNPDLPLYPNPTRDCSRMCSFLGACVSFDDGGDWEGELNLRFSERDQPAEGFWRRRLPSVETLLQMRSQGTPDLEEAQEALKALSEEEREAIVRGEEAMMFTFSMD